MSANATNGLALAYNQWHNHSQTKSLSILVLNLMPNKLNTELQFLKQLNNLHQDVKLTFTYPATHHFKCISRDVITKYYSSFPEFRDYYFDGLIITGAPIECLDFQEIDYWAEFNQICRWAQFHVKQTICECWAAQACLFHDYRIQKHRLNEKLFGIYAADEVNTGSPLLNDCDVNSFLIPQSRHSTINCSVHDVPEGLKVIANNDQIGPLILQSTTKRRTYITGHPEYGRQTLDKEYQRDLAKGLPIKAPCNYYTDTSHQQIRYSWLATSQQLYQNWLNLIDSLVVFTSRI